jgi:hypothetical protein
MWRRVVLVAAACSLIAGACGDDDDDDDAAPDTTETTVAGTDETGAADTGDTATTADTGDTAPDDAPNTASDTGVTEDTIRVAIVAADLAGLVRAGVIQGVPEDAAPINALRISYYLDLWNEEGGINGRTFEYDLITWDPADPTTFDRACSEITLDYQPFMVVNTGGGFSPDSIPCITGDGDTFFVGLDPVSSSIFEASGTNLITLAAPSEINAIAGVEALAAEGELLPSDAAIAVLRGDYQFQEDAWSAAEAALEEAGYTNLVYTEPQRVANLPAADAARNVLLSVEAIRESGATHILNMLPFTNYAPFPDEAAREGLDLQYITIDISAGGCIAFTASQATPPLDGTPCVTSWDNFRIDDAGTIQEDTEFEAQCRTEYEAAYEGQTFEGWELTQTNPGVPWPGLSDAEGTRLDADQPYFECTLMHVLRQGLEDAGSELTHESLAEALYAITDFPVAGASNGQGSFGPDKPFVATAVHFVTLAYNAFTNPPDENGLYGGLCPSPLSCWRTQAGGEWSPITTTLADI